MGLSTRVLKKKCCCLDFRGASGGILLLCEKKVVEKVECMGEFTIACSFRTFDEQFIWPFAGAYGPKSDCNR